MTVLPAIAALLLLPAFSQVTAMIERPEALKIDVREEGDVIEIQLIGETPRSQQISYVLEVTGQSSSRHRGKTTLAANSRTILSKVRTTAGGSWCVRLVAEEENREAYEILYGNCSSED